MPQAGARHRVDALLAAAGWAVAYVAVWATGERLSAISLESQWQLLPLGPLRAHPLRSVWYLHIQPPLWNLLVGCVARWSPLPLALSMQLFLLGCGCVLAATICATLRNLGLARGPALGLTALATAYGGMLLAGFRAQYELPVAALLATLVWIATHRAGPRSGRILVAFSVVLTTLVLTRSLYHPLLIPIALGLLWYVHAGHLSRRALVVAWAIPVVLVGGWLVKNEVVFHTATLSSWTGMNELRSVAPAIDDDTMQRLHRKGTVSGVAAAGFFGSAHDYADALPACTHDHHDPVVTIGVRTVPPDPAALVPITRVTNFNDECLLPAYAAAGKDARALMTAEPGRWLTAREWALNGWFWVPTSTSSSPLGTVANRFQNVGLAVVAHPGLPASWKGHPLWVHPGSLSLVLIAAFFVLLAAGAIALKKRDIRADGAPMVLGALLSGWTFAVGVTFELGEQARFRMATDPVVLALAGLVVLRWWSTRASRREAASGEPKRASNGAPQRRSVAVAGAVLVVGIVLVNVRQGQAPRTVIDQATAIAQVKAAQAAAHVPLTTTSSSTAAPTTTASPSTTTGKAAPTTATTHAPTTTTPPAVVAAAKPRCRFVAHLGDSNLGMSAARFEAAYDQLHLPAIVNSGNGRGAHTVVEGTTALDAIAMVKQSSSAADRCWVIGLSNADARQAHIDGTDPTQSVLDIANAVGDEPIIWIPPVLVSATTDWNLPASTAYALAVTKVAAQRSNITVLDWPSIALQHLDQFQPDGIHYTSELYDLFVSTVINEITTTWEVGR